MRNINVLRVGFQRPAQAWHELADHIGGWPCNWFLLVQCLGLFHWLTRSHGAGREVKHFDSLGIGVHNDVSSSNRLLKLCLTTTISLGYFKDNSWCKMACMSAGRAIDDAAMTHICAIWWLDGAAMTHVSEGWSLENAEDIHVWTGWSLDGAAMRNVCARWTCAKM